MGQSRLLKQNQISWLRGERWGWPKVGLGDELVSMKSEHLVVLKRGRWKEACAQLQQALAPGELWRPGLERDLSRGTVEFVLCGLIQP